MKCRTEQDVFREVLVHGLEIFNGSGDLEFVVDMPPKQHSSGGSPGHF